MGAGLGGLALAQALHRAGDDVVVLDRDPDVGATGGYRITLTPDACAVLRCHLDPELYVALQASSASRDAFQQFHFTDSRLRVLSVEVLPAEDETLLVDRVPLRRLLTRGLEERVRFGAEVTAVSTDASGRPTAHLTSGEEVTGDLLVGADGARSVVARSLAGCPLARPCGLDGTAGQVRLDGHTAAAVPQVLRRGPAIAIGANGVGMFLSLHDPTRARVDPRLVANGPIDVGPATLVWGGIAATELFPRDVAALDGATLTNVVTELMDGWDDGLRRLVARSDPAQVAFFRFVAVDPDAPLTPWPAGRVTALGDAVHVMPPTGGQAGSTAIRDAGALAHRLAEARAGTVALGTAVADFHRDMAGYAPAAVRESLAPIRYIRAGTHPVGRALGRIALPAAARVTEGLWRARGRVG